MSHRHMWLGATYWGMSMGWWILLSQLPSSIFIQWWSLGVHLLPRLQFFRFQIWRSSGTTHSSCELIHVTTMLYSEVHHITILSLLSESTVFLSLFLQSTLGSKRLTWSLMKIIWREKETHREKHRDVERVWEDEKYPPWLNNASNLGNMGY